MSVKVIIDMMAVIMSVPYNNSSCKESATCYDPHKEIIIIIIVISLAMYCLLAVVKSILRITCLKVIFTLQRALEFDILVDGAVFLVERCGVAFYCCVFWFEIIIILP